MSILENQSCIDTTRRFVSREGCTKTILSDSGANFVRAAGDFLELFAALKQTQLEEQVSELSMKWTRNPSVAPLFGEV